MNKNRLSVGQVEKIMGWSYQTALKFANRHGEMINGKWFIPVESIQYVIDQRENDVIWMKHNLSEITIGATEPAT